MSDLSEVDPGTGEILSGEVLMTEDEAQKITAEIKAWAGTLWLKLKQAYDGQAWRAMGYGSWRQYIDTEFDMGKSQAYRLLTHANAVYEIAEAAGLAPEELSPAGDTLTERATRDLDIDAVTAAIRTAMESIEPGAKATRAEITERIIKALRPTVADAVAQSPAPEAEAPAPVSDPTKTLDERMDEAMAKAQAEAVQPEIEQPEVPAPPAAPQTPGENDADGPPSDVDAGPDSDEVTGQHAAQDLDAGAPEGDGSAAAPSGVTDRFTSLPAGVSDLLCAASLLPDVAPIDLLAVLNPFDLVEVCTAFDDIAQWLHEFDNAIKEQNA